MSEDSFEKARRKFFGGGEVSKKDFAEPSEPQTDLTGSESHKKHSHKPTIQGSNTAKARPVHESVV
jgi:hypothetical protein